jgi:hypothetical protein
MKHHLEHHCKHNLKYSNHHLIHHLKHHSDIYKVGPVWDVALARFDHDLLTAYRKRGEAYQEVRDLRLFALRYTVVKVVLHCCYTVVTQVVESESLGVHGTKKMMQWYL